MRREMMFRTALLVGVCFATGAKAAVIFQDDLDGTPGADIVGTTPDVGGNAWMGGGLEPTDQIHFAPTGLGVQDVGPNSSGTNTQPYSSLLTPFVLSSLLAGEVLHLHVTMANISGTPSANLFESTRVDLDTSGGFIGLGGWDFPEEEVNGNWGAVGQFGNLIPSDITTGQSGLFALDLYLDPNDAFGDGATLNAILTVNGGPACPITGTIVSLSSATTILDVRLIRNVDDEVFFRGLTLETTPAPENCVVPIEPASWGAIKSLHRGN